MAASPPLFADNVWTNILFEYLPEKKRECEQNAKIARTNDL